MNQLSDLISRVEGASSGNREIDGDVLVACGCRFRQRGPFEIIEWPDGRRIRGDRIPVTSSLDAALALVERVLPRWTMACDATAPELGIDWELFAPVGGGRIKGTHRTHALALILALLKALQEGIGN